MYNNSAEESEWEKANKLKANSILKGPHNCSCGNTVFNIQKVVQIKLVVLYSDVINITVEKKSYKIQFIFLKISKDTIN